MKTKAKMLNHPLLILFLMMGCSGIGQQFETSQRTYYYGVEINGVLCGYSESLKSYSTQDGKPIIEVKDDILIKLTVLGQDLDLTVQNEYEIDSLSGIYTYCKHTVISGSKMESITEIRDDKIYFKRSEEGEPEEFELSDDLILESPISNNHLVQDFIKGGNDEKEYTVFDDMRGIVVKKAYQKIREEELVLADIQYQTTVLEELNHSTGARTTLWISNDGGFPVKIFVAGRTIFLSDASVKKKIQIADMDNILFARVNQIIPDIHEITYMKVKAQIDSQGEWITAESLNSRGQVFEGEVLENHINGVFELSTEKYDGKQSPGFPYDYPLDKSLGKYVEPGNLIESDDPDLIHEAEMITENSKNSWEAVTALSRWVGENIMGAIPGGTSAINTYRTREGECGSHSRLLAGFCRAIGIPARLAIGCMYSTYLGGSFGQHAWTEVYMGEAGWVAIDATANEYDFIDAGHIRLGEETTFNPQGMEILEYQIGNQPVSEGIQQIPEEYKYFVGNYITPEHNKIFRVFYQDGALSVDIPDKMVLALNEADENDLFYPKISRQINFRFDKDSIGQVNEMRLQQIIPIPKKPGEDADLPNASENPHPQVGRYYLPQANIEISIFVKDKGLVIKDPISNVETKMEQDVVTKTWKIHSTGNQVQFKEDENGKVSSLIYYENIFLTKENQDEI